VRSAGTRRARPVGLLLVFAALLGAPALARGEEDVDADQPVGFGWDDGPVYALGFPDRWFGRDVAAHGRIGGTLYLDGGHVGGDVPVEGWDAVVRRARIFTEGHLHGLVTRTEYKIELAIEDDRLLLNDFYLRWRPERLAETLTLGFMDPPFGLQTLVSSAGRSLMEVAAPTAAFSPGFRLGLEAAGTHRGPDLSWFVNLATVGQTQETGDASNTPIRGTARLVWRPFGVGRDVWHLGLGVTSTGGGDVRFRARPETFLSDYLVDTGDVDGSSTVLGGEVAWVHGSVAVQAEGYYTHLEPSGAGGSLALGGAYLQATWILTGEVRRYDETRAILLRVDPAVPFNPLRGGRGAFELAGRLSWVDLSDGPLRGGRMLTLALGATWTWNRWVRLQAGYVYADVHDRPEASFAHVLQARVELRL
jgi:phosphate-selective porin OprO/OprP